MSKQLLVNATSTSQQHRENKRKTTNTFVYDATAVVIDPILSCVGQRIQEVKLEASIDIPDYFTGLTTNINEWTQYINFGIESKTLSRQCQNELEKQIDNKGAVNLALLHAAKDIQLSLKNHIDNIENQVIDELTTKGYEFSSSLLNWAKHNWGYDIEFGNEIESDGNTEVAPWKLRILKDTGLAAFSIETMSILPKPLKAICGGFISVLTHYAMKSHSGELLHLPMHYEPSIEVADSLSIEQRDLCLKCKDSNSLLKYLTSIEVDYSEVEYFVGTDEDEIAENIRYMLEHYAASKDLNHNHLVDNLSRLDALKQLRQNVSHIQQDPCPLKAHPFVGHIGFLIDTAMKWLRGDSTLYEVTENISDISIDSLSVVSVNDSDNKILESIHAYSMEVCEPCILEIELSKPTAAFDALHNVIVSDLLLMAIDSVPNSSPNKEQV